MIALVTFIALIFFHSLISGQLKRTIVTPPILFASVGMATVFLSIFAHGFTALPGIHLYARRVARLAVDAPEHQEVEQ